MNAELSEQIERYRRKFVHLVKPSAEPWQEALDLETYSPDDSKRQNPEG